MNFAPIDILILSNGPGELTTWVRPVVKALRSQLGDDSPEGRQSPQPQVRISLVLSPCVNASGQEAAIAHTYPEIDRVQGAAAFTPFLLWGKTEANWDWRSRGVVVFLGGDQFYTVVIAKRLGYRSVVYSEWQARWPQWVDAIAAARSPLSVASRYRDKITVIGDLMVDTDHGSPLPQLTSHQHLQLAAASELIGLLPGSKPAKLALLVPLMLATAATLHRLRPQTRFVIPVAPTLDLTTLAAYADPAQNRLFSLIQGEAAHLVQPAGQLPYLETSQGLTIILWPTVPAYEILTQCRLCLTTVGANTAELAALGVPMLVLLPTQQMDVMRAWDGLPGLLANLPGVGKFWAIVILWLVVGKGLGWSIAWQLWTGKAVNWQLFKQGLGLRAWPNICAGREVVPELVGPLQPEGIAQQVLDLLDDADQLEQIRLGLAQVRGESGAAAKLARLVQIVLEK